MGLSGQDWPGDVPRMLDALRPHLGAIPQALENDSFLGIRANCRSGTGITVSAGSGVCCSIIPVREPPFFYGYFGELGGGIDIDSRMLHAVIRAEDGRGPRTALTEPMLRATGHQSVADMLNAMSREGYHPSHLALRPVLFAVALDGDSAAVAIVTGFGRELALLATNLVRRYALEREAVAVVASGSLFVRTGGLLFATFRDEVHAVAPAADVILAAHEPVVGAARAALAARGVAEPAVWQNLCETYAKLQS
jgi:N-acetylglucosamine kinase-like BadF-type ATPase